MSVCWCRKSSSLYTIHRSPRHASEENAFRVAAALPLAIISSARPFPYKMCAAIGWRIRSSLCTLGGSQQGLFRFMCDWLSSGVDVTTSPADRREKPVWREELCWRKESERARERLWWDPRAAPSGTGWDRRIGYWVWTVFLSLFTG